MFADNFSVFGQNVIMSQLRGQAGYLLNPRNELGVWGAWHVSSDIKDVEDFGAVRYRSINQFNVYWRHFWNFSRADTTIWAGVPQRNGLQGAGSLGDYLAGALANVPLGRRVGLFALVTYMHPSSSPGPAGGPAEVWNFTTGLTFSRRGAQVNRSAAGHCWAPLLPVANNGYFLADASQTY